MSNPYGAHFDGAKQPWTVSVDGDWCCIHDADGRYVSDACVEGTREQFRDVATAIRRGESESFKRIRATRQPDGSYTFCSPRNSMGGSAGCSAEDALKLAAVIESSLTPQATP